MAVFHVQLLRLDAREFQSRPPRDSTVRIFDPTPEVKTACEIALMDTYQRYLQYEICSVCGIPEVTLQGTVEDWQRIRDRIEVLATYDLDWWTSRLAPILDEFVATANGEPDLEFWQAIYKPQPTYGAELVSGWIGDLFPYLFSAPPVHDPSARADVGLHDSPACRRNYVLAETRTNWLLPTTSNHIFAAREYRHDIFRADSLVCRLRCNFPISPGRRLR